MSEDYNTYYNNVSGGCLSSAVGMILALLACLLISLLLNSCKAQRGVQVERIEVPVVVTEQHHTESIKIDHIRDTLIQRDSIYHYIKGDTTIIERWHYLQGTTNIARVDTLVKVDSVPYPVQTTHETIETKVQEVNILKWWQKALMFCGGLTLIAGALWLAFIVRRIRR